MKIAHHGVALLALLVLAPVSSASDLFVQALNGDPHALRGLVDMHTHPMAHLGFGGKVFYGAPDVQVLMPAGTVPKCQPELRAQSPADAIGTCYHAHGGHDVFKNPCGDHVRRIVLNEFENGKNTNKPHDVDNPDGFPTFTRWPRADDLLHQMMWVDWLERAYRGGLRVMVALAVNSMTLAHGVQAPAPFDDRASGDRQVHEMRAWVARHPWMEVATSSADLRRIVAADKLAVVLGVELDDIGSFVWQGLNPSAAAVRTEIQRLHRDLDVRYVFPVHVIDNYFGGTAIYEPEFARANRFHFRAWWSLGCATPASGITHRIDTGWDVFKMLALGEAGGTQPLPQCPPGRGFVNQRGLQTLGRVALDEMMRLGMIIDIDHMSERTINETFAHTRARAYPLVSGHSGLRDSRASQRSAAQYRELAARDGLAGVGWGGEDAGPTARSFLNGLRSAESTGVAVALGTDVNGLVKMPGPRAECIASRSCVRYDNSFPTPRYQARTWDYNRNGMAHYGMLPDVLRDVEGIGGAESVDTLFDSAEAFAHLWEISEGRSVQRSVQAAVANGILL